MAWIKGRLNIFNFVIINSIIGNETHFVQIKFISISLQIWKFHSLIFSTNLPWRWGGSQSTAWALLFAATWTIALQSFPKTKLIEVRKERSQKKFFFKKKPWKSSAITNLSPGCKSSWLTNFFPLGIFIWNEIVLLVLRDKWVDKWYVELKLEKRCFEKKFFERKKVYNL